jgi:hypothetical protein
MREQSDSTPIANFPIAFSPHSRPTIGKAEFAAPVGPAAGHGKDFFRGRHRMSRILSPGTPAPDFTLNVTPDQSCAAAR